MIFNFFLIFPTFLFTQISDIWKIQNSETPKRPHIMPILDNTFFSDYLTISYQFINNFSILATKFSSEEIPQNEIHLRNIVRYNSTSMWNISSIFSTNDAKVKRGGGIFGQKKNFRSKLARDFPLKKHWKSPNFQENSNSWRQKNKKSEWEGEETRKLKILTLFETFSSVFPNMIDQIPGLRHTNNKFYILIFPQKLNFLIFY